MKRKLLVGLLFAVIMTANICAQNLAFVRIPINSTAPVAAGVYVDRHTDRALKFTSNSVSYVKWPSGAVIWAVTQSQAIRNVVNRTRTWTDVTGAGNPISRNITENYFAILIGYANPARALFTNVEVTIEVRFEAVARNGRQWIDVYWNPVFDVGGTYGLLGINNANNTHISDLTFYKSYVKQ